MTTDLSVRQRYRRYACYRPVSVIWSVWPTAELLFGRNANNSLGDRLGSITHGPGGLALGQGTASNRDLARGDTRWLYYLTACFGSAYIQHATRYWSQT